jgi:hypothetical protein
MFGIPPDVLLNGALAIGVSVNIWLTLRISNIELTIKLWTRENFIAKGECQKNRDQGFAGKHYSH